MKQLRYTAILAALLAIVIVVTACNRHDDAMAPVDASHLGMATFEGTKVSIDIVPYKSANRVNCTAPNRLICVAILSENGFDATTVDHTTVVFQGATEAKLDEFGDPIRYEKDVDEDGDKDLVVHFLRDDTDLTCDSIEGCLTGETFEDGPIWGCDKINMFTNRPH